MKHNSFKLFCAFLLLALASTSLLTACARESGDDERGGMPFGGDVVISTASDWNETTLYNDLYTAFADYETSVTLPYDCTDVLFDVYRQMLGDHPELFWLPSGGKYSRSTGASGTTVTFTPGITLSKDEIKKRAQQMNDAIDALSAGADAYGTKYEKLLYLHDVLVDRTDYDSAAAAGGKSEALTVSSSAYGCLVNKKAVCSGYAAAFQLLADRIGVSCQRVRGTDRRNGASHEWNLVQLDGDWYHVDVTWDDAVYAGAGNYPNARFYDYFCVTDADVTVTHTIAAGQSLPSCAATKYNYFLVNRLTLPSYAYESAAEKIAEQANREQITLKFPKKADAAAAAESLLAGSLIFQIPAVQSLSPTSVRYIVTDTGTLMIWLAR